MIVLQTIKIRHMRTEAVIRYDPKTGAVTRRRTTPGVIVTEPVTNLGPGLRSRQARRVWERYVRRPA